MRARAAGAVALLATVMLVPAFPAEAQTLTVCQHGCRYAQLAPAVAAASAGDTIRVGRGVYRGGLTINVSVALVGAGAGTTVIRGGGPVLTIGAFGADTEPSVSIRGVTITGGVTRTSPESIPFTGKSGVFALGGGVEIPPNSDFSGGAAVTIKDSVIRGNRVAPNRAIPSGIPCPGGECPFAFAGGGGIDNWGTLTLIGTTVSHNLVGSASHLSALASDAVGGGVTNWLDALTVSDSVLRNNQASATAPIGRYAESGAIQMQGGTLKMNGSDVLQNRAILHAALPNSVDLLAVGGAIHITENAAGSIRHTRISGNLVAATNTVGDANAFSGGLHSDVDLTLLNDVISNNTVRSATLPGSSGNASGDSGAGEIRTGSIVNSRLVHNTVTVRSAAGSATALGGATIFNGTLTNSVINHNSVRAFSPHGQVSVYGGGLVSDGYLSLHATTVTGNAGHANGRTGSALGGGIFTAATEGPPGGPLKLVDSRVTGNVLTASARIQRHGGGIYADDTVTLIESIVRRNRPDQCYGC